jgi:hypothetical protein
MSEYSHDDLDISFGPVFWMIVPFIIKYPFLCLSINASNQMIIYHDVMIIIPFDCDV